MSTESVVSIAPAIGAARRGPHILRRIKEQMGGQDISKQELGVRTGIHRVTIGRALSSARPFTIDELELIADALDVDFDWLLTGSGAPHGDFDGGPGGAPSWARTSDLRIISPSVPPFASVEPDAAAA